MVATDPLLVAPVLLPLANAAPMLDEGQRRPKAVANVLSTALGLTPRRRVVAQDTGPANQKAP